MLLSITHVVKMPKVLDYKWNGKIASGRMLIFRRRYCFFAVGKTEVRQSNEQ